MDQVSLDPDFLAGYRILEIGGDPAAYCGKMLADLGAEVTVVELPEPGPIFRRAYRHAGKRRVQIDPHSTAGAAALSELYTSVDAVVDGGEWTEPDQRGMARLANISFIAARRPDLVWVTLLPFGARGPHAGFRANRLINFAMSGGMFTSGDPALPPCTAPGTFAEDAGGVHAAVAVVAALLAREAGQGGRYVEISIQEAAIISTFPWAISGFSYADRYPGVVPIRPRMGNLNYPIYPCRDGFVRLLVISLAQWRALVDWLGAPEVLLQKEWEDQRYRQANLDALYEFIRPLTMAYTKQELFLEGQRRGVAISPVNRPADLLADPNLAARQFFERRADPDLGEIPVAGRPYRFRTVAVGAAGAAHAPWPASPGEGLPLSGIRVIDLSIGAAGPELTRLLAELGADVIKVESHTYLDFARANGPGGPADYDGCAFFNETNRNKRSLVVDLKTEGGRSVVRRLAALADIVVENNRGHVVRGWGLDYAALAEVRPDLIYLSSQGYGGGGPYADYQAYGANLSAAAGVTYLWNHPGQEMPTGTSLNHPDHFASKQGALAVLAALRRRRRTGQGCHIDLSQHEVAIGLIGEAVVEAAVTGRGPEPAGNRDPEHAPHGAYPCRPEPDRPDLDRWCVIAVRTPAEWEAFCRAIGRPEWLADPRFATAAGRKANEDTLDQEIGRWTQARLAGEVMELLQAAGVPAGVVQHAADQLRDPHLVERGFWVELDHPVAGRRTYPGNPIRTSGGFLATARRAPRLGEHTLEVCRDLLGLPAAEIQGLLASGAIWDAGTGGT